MIMHTDKEFLKGTFKGRPVFFEAGTSDFINDAEIDVFIDSVTGSIEVRRCRCSELDDIELERG